MTNEQEQEYQKAMARFDEVLMKSWGGAAKLPQTATPEQVESPENSKIRLMPAFPAAFGNSLYAKAQRIDTRCLSGHQRAAMSVGLDIETPNLEKMSIDEMRALADEQVRKSVEHLSRPRYCVSPPVGKK